MYSLSVQCVRETIVRDGLRGMYRGVGPPLLGVTPMFAVSFWGYDVGKRIVSSQARRKPADFGVHHTALAGFLLAMPMTFVAAPFERIKVMMQVQTGQLASMVLVVRKIYQHGGIRLIFKGLAATFSRDGPGLALYFGTYEVVKRKLSSDSGELSLVAVSTAGGCAGVAMWLGVFPMDTIKLTQQLLEALKSMAETARHIYRRGGVRGFFPGVGPALARSFPANAATFLGVEVARSMMQGL